MADPVMQPVPQPPVPAKDHTTRNVLLACVVLVTCSLSYYFAIALPSTNAESNRKLNVLTCQNAADDEYWSYFKLNGKPIPGKQGAYTAPVRIWEAARNNAKLKYAECMAVQ
jgi:hypothetical protein